jgi:hypothetical protein
MNKENTHLIELGNFFLRSCPYMVDIGEAWYINKIVLVSPAVFQLLTDEDDMETLSTVAQQIELKTVTLETLKELVLKQWNKVPSNNIKNVTVHFKINNFDESNSFRPPGITHLHE